MKEIPVETFYRGTQAKLITSTVLSLSLLLLAMVATPADASDAVLRPPFQSAGASPPTCAPTACASADVSGHIEARVDVPVAPSLSSGQAALESAATGIVTATHTIGAPSGLRWVDFTVHAHIPSSSTRVDGRGIVAETIVKVSLSHSSCWCYATASRSILATRTTERSIEDQSIQVPIRLAEVTGGVVTSGEVTIHVTATATARPESTVTVPQIDLPRCVSLPSPPVPTYFSRICSVGPAGVNTGVGRGQAEIVADIEEIAVHEEAVPAPAPSPTPTKPPKKG